MKNNSTTEKKSNHTNVALVDWQVDEPVAINIRQKLTACRARRDLGEQYTGIPTFEHEFKFALP